MPRPHDDRRSHRVAVLNMASAAQPGGGFREGAGAQEGSGGSGVDCGWTYNILYFTKVTPREANNKIYVL